MKFYLSVISLLLLVTNLNLFIKMDNMNNDLNNYKNEILLPDNTKRVLSLNNSIVDGEIILLKFFPSESCSICFNKDVKILNDLYSKYSKSMLIYYIKDASSEVDISYYKPEFEYHEIDTLFVKNLFNEDVVITSPTTFLVYENSVIDYFETEISKLGLTDAYHIRIDSIFSNLNYD